MLKEIVQKKFVIHLDILYIFNTLTPNIYLNCDLLVSYANHTFVYIGSKNDNIFNVKYSSNKSWRGTFSNFVIL